MVWLSHRQPASRSTKKRDANACNLLCICNIVAWINVEKSWNAIFQQIINWRFLKCLRLLYWHMHSATQHNTAHTVTYTIYLGNGLRIEQWPECSHFQIIYMRAQPISFLLFAHSATCMLPILRQSPIESHTHHTKKIEPLKAHTLYMVYNTSYLRAMCIPIG